LIKLVTPRNRNSLFGATARSGPGPPHSQSF